MVCSGCESREWTVGRLITFWVVQTIFKCRLRSKRGGIFKIDDTRDIRTTNYQVFITIVVEIYKTDFEFCLALVKWEVFVVLKGIRSDLANVSELTNISDTTCLSLESTVGSSCEGETVEEEQCSGGPTLEVWVVHWIPIHDDDD